VVVTPSDLLRDLYGRLPELAHGAVDGLTVEQLTTAPPGADNHIGWLVWHLARVLDHQLCQVNGDTQLWVSGGWPARFGTDADADNLGYGHTPEQVAGVRPESAEALLEYLDVVHARAQAYLATLGPGDLDRVVDDSYDPPVTLGVRLVSLADDGLQHAGQAAYVRGMLGL
jgi:hypothetical protein